MRDLIRAARMLDDGTVTHRPYARARGIRTGAATSSGGGGISRTYGRAAFMARGAMRDRRFCYDPHPLHRTYYLRVSVQRHRWFRLGI
ncbi:MAG TPA: hypothetical protein PLR44_10620 [Thermomicrobiales bacterium]|nr:hypothetical protein [Thermomicrobiales bacterium]HRA32549.1 hypothetical protein [Thermomicrobiales bacterium]